MLSCSIWFSAPSFWVGVVLESRCVGRVYGADGAVHSTIRTIHTTYATALKTTLLTYSMVQIPSWEANWSAASQETPCISRNPKVHYRTHKRPPSVPILDQPNPVHTHTFHFPEIHLKTTTQPKTRCRKPYAATQHLMLLVMGVYSRNMSS